MHNYQYEINNIIKFYATYNRFPYFFTDNQYEKQLYKDMSYLIRKTLQREISYDEIGDLKFIYEKYSFYDEFDYHYNNLVHLIERGYGLDKIDLYCDYVKNFIEYVQTHQYELELSRYIKFSNLPLWTWKYDNVYSYIDKLYYFTKFKNAMPSLFSNDKSECFLVNFVNIIYYKYIYEKLSDSVLEELKDIKLFKLSDYHKSGLSFLKRYCKENNVYDYKSDLSTFENNFNRFFKFFRNNGRIPSYYEDEYVYSYNIKKMYYEEKLSFLQKNVMLEFSGFDWSYTVAIYKDPSVSKPIFTDDESKEQLINLMKKNKTVSRKDYNYCTHMRIRNTDDKISKKDRLAKRMCNLRLQVIRQFENSN